MNNLRRKYYAAKQKEFILSQKFILTQKLLLTQEFSQQELLLPQQFLEKQLLFQKFFLRKQFELPQLWKIDRVLRHGFRKRPIRRHARRSFRLLPGTFQTQHDFAHECACKQIPVRTGTALHLFPQEHLPQGSAAAVFVRLQ